MVCCPRCQFGKNTYWSCLFIRSRLFYEALRNGIDVLSFFSLKYCL
jgi:hypothetical protein